MSTRNLYVHDNWAELTERIATERALLQRIAVGVPVVALVFAVPWTALPLSPVAATILAQAVVACLFYSVVGWYLLHYHATGVRGALETVGLTLPLSKRHLAYGLVGGCLLAAHFFFTGILTELFTPTWKSWPFMLWQFGFILGLRSLSEELFFRGLIFRQLYGSGSGSFWMASSIATLGNAVPYIGSNWHAESTALVIILFYVAALAMVNALLYRVSNSIVPGIISSIILYSMMVLS